MARFETGPTGNPHYHGFSVGKPGPVMRRVRDDEEGQEDLPPETSLGDFEDFVKVLRADDSVPWEHESQRSREELLDLLCDFLKRNNMQHNEDDVTRDDVRENVDGGGDGIGDDACDDVEESESLGLAHRARELLEQLVGNGLLSEVRGESDEIRRYSLVPPAPLSVASVDVRKSRKKDVIAKKTKDTSIMAPETEGVKTRTALENEFYEFFKDIVTEWNPCFSEDGQWRYKWDEEIGAFDAELPTDMMEGHFTSEQIARSRVSGKEPDRLNLRALLDSVFGSSARQESVDDGNGNVDVQSVRRLIGALVNRVARHTKHGVGKPVLGVHACARGKEGCEFCRYGFPHTCFGRNGVRKMMLEKGEREGQWHAKFPRNDRLCCSYDPHILLANMGNIDWRPVLNLWAVVQYVTKYATKAPKGSRKLQEVLKDAVDEV